LKGDHRSLRKGAPESPWARCLPVRAEKPATTTGEHDDALSALKIFGAYRDVYRSIT
jgi:hypothetical protein